jgi:sialate O-acetylesterase
MKFPPASLLVSLLVWMAQEPAHGEVRLPAVLGSHSVLQQGMPLPIWGWADPGEKVLVHLDEQNVPAQADAKGAWRVTLKPLHADGKTHQLTVTGKNTVISDDLLIGEVWLGSGQSNMAYGLGKDAETLAAGAPLIRFLQVPQNLSRTPAKDVQAEWKPLTVETGAGFSAVLAHFGKRLNEELKVPIGLINSSRGSTAIEQFMPPPAPGPLYNGSVGPLAPVAIRGLLWYQGEANVQMGHGAAYYEKLKTMIEGWRRVWGADFPVYLVQLAPLANYAPDTLPPVWEARMAALKLPKVGLVSTIDLAGNMRSIHPSNKKDVGLRLALWALARDYGRKDIAYASPFYKAMAVEGKSIRLTFTHTAGGLKSKDGKPLSEFEIAGADGVFVPAEAAVEKETIVVHSAEVPSPCMVRFAWSNAPTPNLVNAAGLPAMPFHTDHWTGGTGE